MSAKINGENKIQEETSFSQDDTRTNEIKSNFSQLVLSLEERCRFWFGDSWQRLTMVSNGTQNRRTAWLQRESESKNDA